MSGISSSDAVKWLKEAARYFSARDTGGEDRAFWANIANSETAERIATFITDLDTAHCEPAFIADVAAHIRAHKEPPPDATFEFPEHGFTCFHCGNTFRTYRGALMHFGEKPTKIASAMCIEIAKDRENERPTEA